MGARVLLIDNYDSFTYNLYQFISELGHQVDVHRNDAITVEDIAAAAPNCLVLSPGPGRPENAGICVETIVRFGGRIPILGVCLGHQAIAHAFGGNVVGAHELRHGKTSQVFHKGQGIYSGLPSPFLAVRYHSLVAEPDSLPAELEVDSWTEDGTIMGARHRDLPIYGVQFHPESILTEGGKHLLDNFVKLALSAVPRAVAGRS